MGVQLLVPLDDYSWIWTVELLCNQFLFAAVGTVYTSFFFYFAYLTLLDIVDWVKKTDREHERIVGCLFILASLIVLAYFTYTALYNFALGGYFGLYAVVTSNQDWFVWVPRYHIL
jgi:hypothetical protein